MNKKLTIEEMMSLLEDGKVNKETIEHFKENMEITIQDAYDCYKNKVNEFMGGEEIKLDEEEFKSVLRKEFKKILNSVILEERK